MKIRSKFSIVLLFVLACAAATSRAAPPPRLSCARPDLLKLERFEDGSAQLRCGSHLLVRISSPG